MFLVRFGDCIHFQLIMRNNFALLLILGLMAGACKKNNEVPVNVLEFPSGPENSDIPFVAVNTPNTIPDEPKVSGEMVIFQNQEAIFTHGMGIELRGSTSRRLFPKKSFGIELWDVNGLDISKDIFGFGKEEDWILYGPYSDKALLRNKLIYELSNQIGQYATKTELVEMSLNSDFQGLYLFMEKIKRDGDRLDIEPLQANITDADLITGGYILKIDKTSGDTDDSDWPGDANYLPELGFRSAFDTRGERLDFSAHGPKHPEETYYLYEYPKNEEINEEQKNYIEQYISDFEETLVAEDFSGEERAYEAYIDVQSFVDFFILNELSANPDAYRLSTYMHKDRGGKLKMGPIWDFNLAFGNDARSRTETWIYEYNTFYPEDLWLVHFWWTKLLDDPKFRSEVKTRWNDLRSGLLSTSLLNSQIDQWVDYLESNGAIDRNYEKWDVIGTELPFNSFVGASYEEEVTYMKDWIRDRASWMDGQIASW